MVILSYSMKQAAVGTAVLLRTDIEQYPYLCVSRYHYIVLCLFARSLKNRNIRTKPMPPTTENTIAILEK